MLYQSPFLKTIAKLPLRDIGLILTLTFTMGQSQMLICKSKEYIALSFYDNRKVCRICRRLRDIRRSQKMKNVTLKIMVKLKERKPDSYRTTENI